MYCVCGQRKQEQRGKTAKQKAKSRNGLQSAQDADNCSENINTVEWLPSLSSSPGISISDSIIGFKQNLTSARQTMSYNSDSSETSSVQKDFIGPAPREDIESVILKISSEPRKKLMEPASS